MRLKHVLLTAFFFGALYLFSYCTNRLRCNPSSSVLLGHVDFSERFEQMNIESGSDSLVFIGSNDALVFVRNNNRETDKRRFNAYKICTSIDIKPYTAYAYYEYNDRSSFFKGDSLLLVVQPAMSMEGEQVGESLYLSFSTNKGGLKARVPISNIDLNRRYMPYGELFELQDSVVLDGDIYRNVWKFTKERAAMYYHMRDGIVGLVVEDELYLRK